MHVTNKKTYPFNLICKIYGVILDDNVVNTIYFKGLFERLEWLDDIEKSYIRLRFQQNLTRKDCAVELDVSMHDINRIESDLLNTLRKPINRTFYEGTAKFRLEHLEHTSEYIEDENKMLKDLLTQVANGEIKPKDLIIIKDTVTSVSRQHIDLRMNSIGSLDLSVRAFNSLYRTGYRTLGDVIDSTREELSKCKNLGEISLNQILSELDKLGLSPRENSNV